MKDKSINPPRGMRDILPQEMRLRHRALSIINETYEQFGFTRIETPVIESLDILQKDTKSENTKLVFAILKRGEELEKVLNANNFAALADLGLRYDLTVPLARYYATNRTKLPRVFKSIQIGPVWRAERPQKGRYRQFYQCDIDVLGSHSFHSELELIRVSTQALLNLGFKNFVIQINDRKLLHTLMLYSGIPESQANNVLIIIDKLDKIGLEGVKEELKKYLLDQQQLELLIHAISNKGVDSLTTLKTMLTEHSSSSGEAQLGTSFDPKIVDELSMMVNQINHLSNGQYQCVFNPALVRGMGYYTGTIFEVTYKDYPFSIAGGGRYDNMINDLISENIPACGISLGFERLMGIIMEENLLNMPRKKTIALIYHREVDADFVIKTTNDFSKDNRQISLYERQKNFSRQLNELYDNGIYQYITIDKPDTISPLKEITKVG